MKRPVQLYLYYNLSTQHDKKEVKKFNPRILRTFLNGPLAPFTSYIKWINK